MKQWQQMTQDELEKYVPDPDGEIERLQEQLKEANYVISIYRCYDDTEYGRATEYCKKWGIK